jgi:hypothetical protein
MHRNKSLIISILLMMVCVQTFSMHFHSGGEHSADESHASAHIHSDMDTDHLALEHDGEAHIDIETTVGKQSFSLDLFVFLIVLFFSVLLPKSHRWLNSRGKCPPRYLLFFRPPLRAPPV